MAQRIALFRVQLFRQNGTAALQGSLAPPRLLRKIFPEKPSARSTKTVTWRVGNFEPIDKNWAYFRIGKTTSTKNEEFVNGNFVELQSDSAPSTPGFIHFDLELIGITHKGSLSPRVEGIGNRLRQVIAEHSIVTANNIEVEVNLLREMDGYIALLKRAHRIRKFWIRLTPPNALDENAVLRALSKTVGDINAGRGKFEVDAAETEDAAAEGIDADSASRLAVGANSRGNRSGAHIVENQGDGSRPIHSEDVAPAKVVTVEKGDLDDPDRRQFIAEMLGRAFEEMNGEDE